MSDSIWKKVVSVESVNKLHANTAVSHLGIKFIEVGPDYMAARMPVDEHTRQPYGLLHGGAMVLLAETLCSCAAHSAAADDRMAVGLEINANHLRAVRSGHVTGTCRALHVGRTTQVWQVEIRNDEDDLCCVSRMTASIVPL